MWEEKSSNINHKVLVDKKLSLCNTVILFVVKYNRTKVTKAYEKGPEWRPVVSPFPSLRSIVTVQKFLSFQWLPAQILTLFPFSIVSAVESQYQCTESHSPTENR